MSEAGKREAGGEKERRIETGVMESRMYFFLKSFFLIFTCADFRFMCWRRI